MDTVLGLSLTSTAVGWVLVEGRDADGAILDHDAFTVRTGGGTRAVKTAERVTEAVLRARALAIRHDQRVRVIGLTWSDDVAAEAALVQESLIDAGLDNVVPIRALQAAEMLAQGIAPVVGADTTAVCVLDSASTIVAMVDAAGDQTQTAVKHLPGNRERLVSWLSTMFDRSAWHPGSVVVVGSDDDLDVLSWQLENALPVPVFTQSGPELALAQGAALVSARSTEFTDARLVESIERDAPAPVLSGSRSYARAMTMLAAGAVTFVASLSLAVGPRLLPDRPPAPVQQAARRSASPPVVEAPAPSPAAIAAPTARAAPEPAPPDEPLVVAPPVEQQSGVTDEPPADLFGTEPESPPPPVALPPPVDPPADPGAPSPQT